ncbi:MAG: CDP-diacylglycerol--glycerol-3-phosphate 3-phosphatidyltransferase [Rubrimonas sp.]|uniref:CDP-diacylglycerol--glycerol-3-phosphate 3-phosphatidyltransferase n=1 Tax=Rubrimonas sp. TaxID=2036015 RepID=UPI002FDCC2E9
MWTLPNILTVGRLLAAPCVLLAIVALPEGKGAWAAFALFAAAALTDWLDGKLARARGQESGFGRMLDPIADKAMTLIALAALMGLHGPAFWLAAPVAVIVLRETAVAGLREYLQGADILSVTRLAKWKTTAQLAAIAVLLAATASGAGWMLWLGGGLLWLAAALTAVTGWDYFARGLAVIAADDAAKGR